MPVEAPTGSENGRVRGARSAGLQYRGYGGTSSAGDDRRDPVTEDLPDLDEMLAQFQCWLGEQTERHGGGSY